MALTAFRTAPVASPDMPRGIPYIIVNDITERFSFYGVRAILVIFMTQYLMSGDGQLATMSDERRPPGSTFSPPRLTSYPSSARFSPTFISASTRTIIFLSLAIARDICPCRSTTPGQAVPPA